MKIESCATVGELAASHPQATRILEKAGIDYCCGGRKPLEQACGEAGITTAELLAQLRVERPNTERDWASASASELIRHIEQKHHAYVREEVPRLAKLLAKVRSVHGARHPELERVERVFAATAGELTRHMLKEEQILFPYIERMEQALASGAEPPPAFFGSVANPIQMMMQEHEAAGDSFAELRQRTENYTVPADGCVSYRTAYAALAEFEADLHQHVHLENNILFPRAIELENRT